MASWTLTNLRSGGPCNNDAFMVIGYWYKKSICKSTGRHLRRVTCDAKGDAIIERELGRLGSELESPGPETYWNSGMSLNSPALGDSAPGLERKNVICGYA